MEGGTNVGHVDLAATATGHQPWDHHRSRRARISPCPLGPMLTFLNASSDEEW